ncbi:cytochrome P450 [Alcanivorax venustensis ISO4]|jgi:cytochrome P450|uniref:Cytochrome P450 n=2 Tax=Alloalcanivorax venustensis TaxID=172371 RepID=A0ABS0AGS3_9GAMM|nr:cytochrome P450 [Alloalcanivorax venustensis ISO4]|tara:strand:+ start:1756 stop:3000 length:1245 start_codon:yes stop_codon:yes gene_type:complete
MRDPVGLMRQRYDQYGPVSWTRLFGLRVVQMLGPDANQFVLMNKGDLFSNHGGWDFFIGPFFHRGIMLLDFEEHRWHRRIMQQAFTKNALRGYLERMGPRITAGLDTWPEGGIKVLPRVKRLTLDLATDVFMGQELGPRSEQVNRAFVDTVRAGTALLRFPVPGLRWSKGLRGRRVLEQLFRDEIPTKRAQEDNDLFSALCHATTEDGDRFSDDDVVNHMIFLMMAAHDTTTITLSNLFYHLASAPEWQERLREESRALGKTQLEYEDLEKLPGIGLAMKEALRLCAPVPSLPRRTVRDVEYDGFHIPKGSFITMAPYFTHYMEEYWPDAERFDPERFAEHRREDKVHPYAWVPFGGGAHKCIGLHFADMQVKAILHQVLLKYRWRVPADYVMPVDTTSLPVPKDGLPVTLERL